MAMNFSDILRSLSDYCLRVLPAFHHILMFINFAAIVLLSLVTASCSSNSPLLTEIFLLGFKEAIQNSTNSGLEVRVGYFGYCILSDSLQLCGHNPSLDYPGLNLSDPSNLLSYARDFKSNVLLPHYVILSIICAFFAAMLLATFPGWHMELDEQGSIRDVKPFPSRPVTNVVLAFQTAATALALVSVVRQQSAASAYVSAVNQFRLSSVATRVGAAGSALAWVGCVLEILVLIGVVLMIESIKILDRLVDGSDGRSANTDGQDAQS